MKFHVQNKITSTKISVNKNHISHY